MPDEAMELSEDLSWSSGNKPERFFPGSTRGVGRYLREVPGAIATAAMGLTYGILYGANVSNVPRPAPEDFEFIYSSSVNIAPAGVSVHSGETYAWLIFDEERGSGITASPLSVISIQTLTPEPYELLKHISVVLEKSDDQYLASFYDANLSASGDTREEAILNFKDVLLGTFDLLSSLNENELGPMPRRQFAVLREYIRPRE